MTKKLKPSNIKISFDIEDDIPSLNFDVDFKKKQTINKKIDIRTIKKQKDSSANSKLF